MRKPTRLLLFAAIVLAVVDTASLRAAPDTLSAGPLYDEFRLTIGPGLRREAAGPLWYSEERWETEFDSEPPRWGEVTDAVRTLAFPPLFSRQEIPRVDGLGWDFVYPLITYDRYGAERWFQVLQLLSFSAGRDATGVAWEKFSFFPFYFQRRASDSSMNYTAVWPFCGHVEKRFFRDEVDWVLWPAYVRTRKKEIVTHNLLAPFFHTRSGPGLTGWQFWPLVGMEHQTVTRRTNFLGDLETVPGHESFFALWPILFHNDAMLGTTNPVQQSVFLPWFSFQLSPAKDIRTYLWPLGVTLTDDREHDYRQVDVAWPLIGFGRGATRKLDRVFPLYSRSEWDQGESGTILWPAYRYRNSRSAVFERRATYGLLGMYANVKEQSLETGAKARRTDLWPLFISRRDTAGNQRFQMLALLEPFLPRNDGVTRNYSLVWSLWRSEHDQKTGRRSQSLLWNLYRCERTPVTRKCSVLLGLVQYEADAGGSRWRWLHLFGGRPKNAQQVRVASIAADVTPASPVAGSVPPELAGGERVERPPGKAGQPSQGWRGMAHRRPF